MGWVVRCSWALVCALALVSSASRAGTCGNAVANVALPEPVPLADVVRELSDLDEFALLQWNMLNVQHHVGSLKWDPVSETFVDNGGHTGKPEHFLAEQGKILLEEQTDLFVGEELEGKPALDGFVRDWAGGKFRSYMERGNDGRGIEIGFLLRNDLPFEVELRTNKHVTWYDPSIRRISPLFSRDLPVLILRIPGNSKPVLILVGTHYKSKRPRPGEPESRGMAKAQADGTEKILLDLQKEFGKLAPIIFAGDTNGDFNQEAEFAKLKRALDFEDVLDIANPKLHPLARVTHTYHPEDGSPTKRQQLDVIAVTPALRACVKRAEIVRYRWPDGGVKPIPATFNQRKKNPSDHFPVKVVFDWKCILELWSRPLTAALPR